MSVQGVILTGVGIYVVLMIVLGVYASKKTHSITEFAVAGRSLPLWLCMTTIVVTWFGGGVMIGVAGSAYDEGMLGVIAVALTDFVQMVIIAFGLVMPLIVVLVDAGVWSAISTKKVSVTFLS